MQSKPRGSNNSAGGRNDFVDKFVVTYFSQIQRIFQARKSLTGQYESLNTAFSRSHSERCMGIIVLSVEHMSEYWFKGGTFTIEGVC